jgi:transposase
MARRQKEPLRALTAAERAALEQVVRASSERADCVARAGALLAVADGATFAAAARAVGRRAGDAVARLVARFNQEGLAAVTPRHGGGPARRYRTDEQERILREFRRTPDRERDGTATWSLGTLKRALRAAPDGLPTVSTWTILHTLHEAGYTWQGSRTWCPTGLARRKRKDGTVVQTVDPDATAKRGRSSRRTA